MKNKFLKFLSKYWICFLLSVIMIVGLSLSTRYAHLYESGSGMIRFDLRETYLVGIVPLYSLIYGCLSYIKTRKIWISQFILGIVVFLYWFRFDIDTLAWAGTFIWTAYPFVFSLIGTFVTAFVCYIIKSLKSNID